MKISVEAIAKMKQVPNSLYGVFKTMFLYHSNKLEGSTFTLEALQALYLEHRIIQTEDQQLFFDDVIQTKNSLDVFDYIISTLGEPITKEYICECHRILTKDSSVDTNFGASGIYKLYPNRIAMSSVQVALPSDVEKGMEQLFATWNASEHTFEDIVSFHSRFEHIHPFQDGNGRIGRFLMLKQCLENNIDLIMVDIENSALYKTALENSQVTGDMKDLAMMLRICQERFTAQFESYKAELDCFETMAMKDKSFYKNTDTLVANANMAKQETCDKSKK